MQAIFNGAPCAAGDQDWDSRLLAAARGRGRGRSKPNRSGRLTEAGTGRAGVKDEARARDHFPSRFHTRQGRWFATLAKVPIVLHWKKDGGKT
jgi:hypothetical protein